MNKFLLFGLLSIYILLTGCSAGLNALNDSSGSSSKSGSSVQEIPLESIPFYNHEQEYVSVSEEGSYLAFDSTLEGNYGLTTLEITYSFTSDVASFYIWYAKTESGPQFPILHITSEGSENDTWITATVTTDLSTASKLRFELLGSNTKVKSVTLIPN